MEFVHLNIGGNKFCTTVDTLTREPQSMLAAMFSGRHTVHKDNKGHVCIDRDGKHFGRILNWLRDGVVRSLSELERLELLQEAEYYQLHGLVDKINEVLTKEDTDLTRKDIIKCVQSNCLKFRGVNLSGLDLSKLDLSNVDLSHSCLKNVNFSGAILRRAKFQSADLSNANLEGANMEEAYFKDAILDNATLKNGNLKRANLCGVNLQNTHLRDVNWYDALEVNMDKESFVECL